MDRDIQSLVHLDNYILYVTMIAISVIVTYVNNIKIMNYIVDHAQIIDSDV